MKTRLVLKDNKFGCDVCIKKAENKHEKESIKILAKIIFFINKKYPEIFIEILSLGADNIVLRALPGKCFPSKDAFLLYSQNEWIIDSIVTKLNYIQSVIPTGFFVFAQKLRMLKFIRKSVFNGCKLPPSLIKHITYILFGKFAWVYSHGDFTEYNLAVDFNTKTVHFIDWEAFDIRPLYYDDFLLIFHYCVPLADQRWQLDFAKKKFGIVPLEKLLSMECHCIAVIILYYLYFLEVYRSKNIKKITKTGKFPGKDIKYFKQRATIRYKNLSYILCKKNWKQWVVSWKDSEKESNT